MRILHLLLLIPILLSVPYGHSAHAQVDDRPRLLLISFDGFRYDYLSETETPNFDRFIREGVKAEALIPVFPTKTFPNHYSIVTGLYPEHSGIVANTMYDPKWDRWYRISERTAVENPDWYRGEPIWNTAMKQGLTAGTLFWVGSEAPIQGMRPTRWKRYDGSMPERARIDTAVSWLESGVDLATLYFELVDDAGHDFGLHSDSLTAAIGKADELIGYLQGRLSQAGLWDATDIVIVSDHGMAELSRNKIIELDSIIDLERVEWMVWDPVTLIQPKRGSVEMVYPQLKKRENELHYRVYRKDDLPERYHYSGHRRIPDLIMIAEPGYTILDSEYKSRFLRSLPSGNHGYDNGAPEMQGFFAARGPAFVSQDTVGRFQSIHIYELMCDILGIEAAPNDGSPDSIRVLLNRMAEDK